MTFFFVALLFSLVSASEGGERMSWCWSTNSTRLVAPRLRSLEFMGRHRTTTLMLPESAMLDDAACSDAMGVSRCWWTCGCRQCSCSRFGSMGVETVVSVLNVNVNVDVDVDVALEPLPLRLK